MTIESTHPDYDAMEEANQISVDTYDGELTIKSKDDTYLPPTAGHREDGWGKGSSQKGQQDYDTYKSRPPFPDDVEDAIDTIVGALNRKEAVINLPPEMEHLRDSCTIDGESLGDLLRKIHMNQLLGRIGLLADLYIDEDKKPVPYISTYKALGIRNWATEGVTRKRKPILFVLDESGPVMDVNLQWKDKTQYRVLALVSKNGDTLSFDLNDNPDNLVFATGVIEKGKPLDPDQLTIPSIRGTELDHIPFTVINPRDLALTPDKPPVLGLALLCIAIYKGEADYRQALSNQSHDTLVTIGAGLDEDDTVRVGAGARIDITNTEGDAKFIGSSSQGLSEQRTALENDKARASAKAGQLINTGKKTAESGDALKTRISADTVTLPQLAKTAAKGLENCLKSIAVWIGAKPEKVEVIPNLDFTPDELDGATLVQIVQAKSLNAPISDKSVHRWMREQGVTKMTYEDEIKELQLEGADVED